MSGKGEEAEFHAALETLETAYREGIRAFADWYAKTWQMTEEEWRRDFAEPPPEGTWFDGHNAGVEGILLACDFFLDEERGR